MATPPMTTVTTTVTSVVGPVTTVSTGLRMGQVTTGTKMVLASKLGSQVSFQPDKNFQQSFASWVKQGQTNNSGKPGKNYRISPLHARTVHCTLNE